MKTETEIHNLWQDAEVSETESKARYYACYSHNKTCHEYDGKLYSVHLCHVRDVAERYKHLFPDGYLPESVAAACWCHDLIEDCRITYNDLRKVCGIQVAEIVYAVTQPKGKNRKERNSDAYYEGIKAVYGATFVKLCDRLANVEHGLKTGSNMVEMYRKEHPGFYYKLATEDYLEMWNYLNDILTVKP